MRWLRTALFFLAGLVTLLVMLVALLVSVDFGRFKSKAEVLVSEQLGREFRIDGDLHLNLGMSIELFAEDVFLANPVWAEEGGFFTVRKIDVSVDTWSLINGPIIVQRAEIDGITVSLEQGQTGESSWVFEGIQKEPAEQLKDIEVAVPRLPVILNYAAISDIRVTYNNPEREAPIIFVAESFKALRDENDYIEAELTGALNGTPLNFSQSTGPIEELLGYANVSAEFEGNIGEITFRGSSWVDDLLAPHRPRLKLNIKGPNAQYLTDILAIQPVNKGPLELSVSIEESGDVMIATLECRFGEFDLNIDGRFADAQQLKKIELNIQADGPNIGTVFRLLGNDYSDIDPFEIRGKIARSGDDLSIDNVLVIIGESNLTINGFFDQFPTARGASLTLIASGPDYGRFNHLFGMPGRLGGSFTTTLSLTPQDDGRTLVDFDANAPDIRISANSLLSSTDDFVGSTLQFEIDGPDVGRLSAAAGMEGWAAEPFQITGSVEKDSTGFRLSDIRAAVDDEILYIEGHIGDDPIKGETDLKIDIRGSDLGASVVAFGGPVSRLPKGVFHLKGALQKQDDKLLFKEVDAAIGDNAEYQLRSSGYLMLNEDFRDSQISLLAQGESLAALAELFGQTGIPDREFSIGGDVRRGSSNTYVENGKLNIGGSELTFDAQIGDSPLQQDLELTFDALVPDLRRVASDFGVSPELIPEGGLLASASIRQEAGEISLERFNVSIAGSELSLDGRIGMLPDLEGTILTFELQGADLSRLLPGEIAAERLAYAFDANGRISITDSEVQIDRMRAHLGNLALRGGVTVGLDPLLGRGRYSLEASSPDLYDFFPKKKADPARQPAEFNFNGKGGWAANYWNFEKFDLAIGKGRLVIDGSLDGPPEFGRTDLHVDWQVSSLRKLSPLVGRELPDHKLRLIARFVGTDDVLTMENFDLTFGESDVHGYFTMRGGDLPAIEVDVDSELFDISEYFPELEDEVDPAQSDPNRRVIPDTPLPMSFLRTFEADIDIDIDTLRSQSFETHGLGFTATVSAGALVVERLTAESLRGGHLTMSAKLLPNESGGADFDLATDGEDLVMGIMAKSEEDMQHLPLFDLRAELAGSGASVSELAGSLNGYFRLVGHEGRFRAGSFSFITQDFVTELVNTINPFASADPYTNVKCNVILLHFEDGVMEGRPAFVQLTNKLKIVSDLTVDLKTEKIDAVFEMIPQKGLGISVSSLINPYIKLTGTLAQPSLVMNPESVLLEGGAAVATAGLTILAKSFKNRFLSEKDPCGKAVEKADLKFGISEAEAAR